jgi:1,4-alpha-glucan branching enzyme
VVLSSDEAVFGGWRNVTKDADAEFPTAEGDYDNRPLSFKVYAPCRTVVVYAPAEFCDPHADEAATGVPGLAVKGHGPYFSA